MEKSKGLYPVHETCGGAIAPAARFHHAPKLGRLGRKLRGYCGKCGSYVAISDAELRQSEVAALVEDVHRELATLPRRRARTVAAPVPLGWPAPSFAFEDGCVLWWHPTEAGDAEAIAAGTVATLGHVEAVVDNAADVLAKMTKVGPVFVGAGMLPMSVRISGWIDVTRVVVDASDLGLFVRELERLDPLACHAD